MGRHDDKVRSLIEDGETLAERAGITLADKPMPLYQLLVLSTLLSARISADLAIGGARELFAAGYRTPDRMRAATWQQRVDALGRGGYRRYDERTATMLDDAAGFLQERWRGDLRRLRDEASGEASQIHSLLQEVKGIGPTGASIFLREVQAVWPQVAPYVDERVREAAAAAGLPKTPERLADLAGSTPNLVRLSAALLRTA